MSDVFICYSRKDAEFSGRLKRALEARGLSVFVDTDTKVGKVGYDNIDSELRAAACVLVVWSRHSRSSTFVIEEADYGRDKGNLVPVLIDGLAPSDIPYGFRLYQAADLTSWRLDVEHSGFDAVVHAIRELVEPAAATVAELSSEVKSVLTELSNFKITPPRRLALGDRLDDLSDPRVGVGIREDGVPDVSWVDLKETAYIYQDRQPRICGAFSIAKYPVTNRQYNAFLASEDYQDPQYWLNGTPLEGGDIIWPRLNRPRVSVSWIEAEAFARWMSRRIDRDVRLPTEMEWERAVRGPDGRMYPWGNDYESGRCNVNERQSKSPGRWNLAQTCAVGVFPQGASIDGVFDLAGNVFEMCQRDELLGVVGDADMRTDFVVIRGGAWYGGPRFAAATYRTFMNHACGARQVGFRLVASGKRPKGRQ